MYIVTLNSLETYSSFVSGKGFLTVTMTQADTLHNQILLMCHTLKLPQNKFSIHKSGNISELSNSYILRITNYS